MATAVHYAPPEARESHRGPPLGLVATVFVALVIASLALDVATTGNTPYTIPYDPPDAARAYFGSHAGAIGIGAFLMFGAAIPLGIFAATVVSRLRFFGLNVAGVTIALFGGISASVLLALAALTTWVLAQPGVADDLSTLRALQSFAFATGGPGHIAMLGLLLAGVSVPAAFAKLLPSWLVWLGLIVAVIAELSTLSLVVPVLDTLLPLARFLALVWLIGVGFTMPASRSASAHG